MNGHFPLGELSPNKYFFSLACIFGLIFALMGYQKSGHSFVFSLTQWQLQAHFTMLFFTFSHTLLFGRLGRLADWQKLILSALISSLFFAPFSLLIDVYLLQEGSYQLNDVFHEWLNMAPPTILCWLLINLPWTLGVRFKRQSPPVSSTVDNEINKPQTQSPLTTNEQDLKKVKINEATFINPEACDSPPAKTLPHFFSLCQLTSIEQLLFLKAELHYLNVVTTHGKQLILYNLKDAISELSEYNPIYVEWQTHRSYWVNKVNAHGFKRKGREGEILFNDVTTGALVSRQHMAKVKCWELNELKYTPLTVAQ